jgi:glycosyltransferase involved in cell wall biosynthesis
MEHNAAILMDELMKRGAEVSVATTYEIDLMKLFRKFFGIELPYKPRTYVSLPTSKLSFLPFHPFWNWFSLRKAIHDEKPDVIYIDGYNYRIPKSVMRTTRIVVYIDEPIPQTEISELKGEKEPMYVRLYSNIFRSTLLSLVTQDEPVGIPVCNSNWSGRQFRELTGKEPRVIHPPVAVENFYSSDKENLVTCVGNLNPRKKFERAIHAISKCKTSPELQIIGNKHGGHFSYLKGLKRLAKDLDMEDRVHFRVDAPFDDLRDILSRSKICISCGIEYFGIAVVEQMASGCVPIVYRASAPWHEIIEHGRYGYSFKTESELADIIDKLLTNKSLFRKMSDIAKKRAHAFDQKIFRQKMANLILTRR